MISKEDISQLSEAEKRELKNFLDNHFQKKKEKLEEKDLIKAINENTMHGEVEFNDGKEKMPVVPLQYIAEELQALKHKLEEVRE